jgi:sulfide:quinone oxidoreductase
LNPEKLKIGLERPMKKRDIVFLHEHVREIDPITKQVFTEQHTVSYDFLVVATGAGMREQEVPGMAEYAERVWSPTDMLKLQVAFYQLAEQAHEGHHRQVLFLVPPNNKCSGPLYELGLMLDTWLRRKGVRRAVDIVWSTYESGYIQAFGPRLNEVIAQEFADRGIDGYPKYAVERIERGAVHYTNGRDLAYDLLVTFPPSAASTAFAGLPADQRGFITTEPTTRQVMGYPEIYAVGDTSDFPVKQAFLAFLQADATAERLAANILGTQPAFEFEPVSMCVMEQFDKATFAQVPLHLTGRPEKPLEVLAGSAQYKVGSGALWRLGKAALGFYLPLRFNEGNPFHAGIPWKGMELGLKAMSGVLAH